MVKRKVAFGELDWEYPFQGVRHRYVDQDGRRFRLVEYSTDMPPHWCDKGHYGYMIDGEMEIEYEDETILYKAGDALIIPEGEADRHRARAVSDKVVVFFLEKS